MEQRQNEVDRKSKAVKDLNDLDLEIQSLAAEIAALRNKQSQIRKNAMIKCAQCDHGTIPKVISFRNGEEILNPAGRYTKSKDLGS